MIPKSTKSKILNSIKGIAKEQTSNIANVAKDQLKNKDSATRTLVSSVASSVSSSVEKKIPSIGKK